MKRTEVVLDEYLGRTTPEAAETGRLIINFILSLPNTSCKTNKATIDFRAERQFCSLWPVKNHITFWITKTDKMKDPEKRLKGNGKTANLKVKSNHDFDDYLKLLIAQSYESEGLIPLKGKRNLKTII